MPPTSRKGDHIFKFNRAYNNLVTPADNGPMFLRTDLAYA